MDRTPLAGSGPEERDERDEREDEGDCDGKGTGRTKACAEGRDQGGVII